MALRPPDQWTAADVEALRLADDRYWRAMRAEARALLAGASPVDMVSEPFRPGRRRDSRSEEQNVNPARVELILH